MGARHCDEFRSVGRLILGVDIHAPHGCTGERRAHENRLACFTWPSAAEARAALGLRRRVAPAVLRTGHADGARAWAVPSTYQWLHWRAALSSELLFVCAAPCNYANVDLVSAVTEARRYPSALSRASMPPPMTCRVGGAVSAVLRSRFSGAEPSQSQGAVTLGAVAIVSRARGTRRRRGCGGVSLPQCCERATLVELGHGSCLRSGFGRSLGRPRVVYHHFGLLA